MPVFTSQQPFSKGGWILISKKIGLIIEGPEKAIRGEDECEPIKIHRGNLTYIPESTRSPSLLTRPRPVSYRQAIDLRNRARNYTENTEWC
jgi:hypothetical protein